MHTDMRQGKEARRTMATDLGGNSVDAPERGRAGRTPRRLFADDDGVLWTAELRRPARSGSAANGGRLILFWSEDRACITTLKEPTPIADLSEEELRRHLRTCLTG